MQRVHEERAVLWPHGHQALPVAERELRDRDSSGFRKGLVQERIRLLGRLLRLEVVGRLVIQRARELVVLDEAGDVDRLARAERELLEVFVGQLDVVSLLVLVAAHDVPPRDLVVALDAPTLVLDAAPVLRAKEVERDFARALRCEI